MHWCQDPSLLAEGFRLRIKLQVINQFWDGPWSILINMRQTAFTMIIIGSQRMQWGLWIVLMMKQFMGRSMRLKDRIIYPSINIRTTCCNATSCRVFFLQTKTNFDTDSLYGVLKTLLRMQLLLSITISLNQQSTRGLLLPPIIGWESTDLTIG